MAVDQGESVLTPLIVVSFSKEGIQNAINGGNFQSIVGGEDVFTFPNSHSNNFTKLTHTFNVNDIGWRIRLEMIDPVAEFEAKFLSMRLEDRLASELFVTEGEITSDIEQKLCDLEESNIPGGGNTANIIEATKQQRIWITYGIGNDIKDWAGPFAVILTGANLRIDTGNIKKLILDFSPNRDPVTTPRGVTGKRDIKLSGIKYSAVGRTSSFVAGDGKLVGSEDYGDGDSVGNWSEFAENAGVGTEGREDLGVFFENFDVHASLMTCVRTMVRKVTNCNNVITLFPNINIYGIKAIATAVACDRGSGIKASEEKEQFLMEAADKVFSKFGATVCVHELGKLLVGDPTSKDPLETNYRKYLDLFPGVDAVKDLYIKKGKHYIQMKAITETIDGFRFAINDKISKIREALQNTTRGYDIEYQVESRPDIIEAFKGVHGVTGDGPIVFYGDRGLIKNIVYGDGGKAQKYLHPTDTIMVGKGIVDETPLPEFRMNTPNPNIISIEGILDNVYNDALLSGYTINAKSRVANVGAVLTKAAEAYGEAADVDTVIESITTTGSVGDASVAKLLVAAEKYLTKTEAKTTVEMDPSMGNNPIGILTSAYEELHRTMVNLVITTLPHFHLSDNSIQGMECIVIGSIPQALVPSPRDSIAPPRPFKTTDIENSFFNGAYTIVGYVHEITSTGIAKSKFILTKIVAEDPYAGLGGQYPGPTDSVPPGG